MPTTIDSAGITFNDATSFTSATLVADSVGTTQIANGSVIAAKLGTDEQKQICKAWVNFDGTTATPSTIRSSYNVSSVTKNSTGNYTVNFTAPMDDANYSATSNCGSNSTAGGVSWCHGFSSGLFQIQLYSLINQAADLPSVSIQVFGN
jgi:hypothetical protein